MKIIALLGKSRVGKDTAASILSPVLGYEIRRLSTPVKDACHVLFDLPRDVLESDAKERIDPRYGQTPRDLMVWLTAALQQNFPPDFFVRRLLMQTHSTSKGIIIPDVRYPQDVKLLRQRGAVIVKITRGHAPVLHAHEACIDQLEGDLCLRNDTAIADFQRAVHALGDQWSRCDGDFGRDG